MRTLRFTVDSQKIRHDPNCDFSGLVSGTAGYLKASFKFSKEWSGMVKVAEFANICVVSQYPCRSLIMSARFRQKSQTARCGM